MSHDAINLGPNNRPFQSKIFVQIGYFSYSTLHNLNIILLGGVTSYEVRVSVNIFQN